MLLRKGDVHLFRQLSKISFEFHFLEIFLNLQFIPDACTIDTLSQCWIGGDPFRAVDLLSTCIT